LKPVSSVGQVGGEITPENTLRNRRIAGPRRAGDYGAGNLIRSVIGGDELDRSNLIQQHMEATMPMLEEQRQKRMGGLIDKTAAMGRTGSGMFNTDVGNLELATRRGHESLLGKLSAEAAGQEIQDRLGAARQAQGLRGQDIQQNQAATAHLRGERGYEDSLARQAMADEARRMGYLQSIGQQYDPTAAMFQGSDIAHRGSQMYGANAESIGNTLQQGASSMMQAGAQSPGGGGGILDFVGDAVGQFVGGGGITPGGVPGVPQGGIPVGGEIPYQDRVEVPGLNVPGLQ
jgi:hypothetical protein